MENAEFAGIARAALDEIVRSLDDQVSTVQTQEWGWCPDAEQPVDAGWEMRQRPVRDFVGAVSSRPDFIRGLPSVTRLLQEIDASIRRAPPRFPGLSSAFVGLGPDPVRSSVSFGSMLSCRTLRTLRTRQTRRPRACAYRVVVPLWPPKRSAWPPSGFGEPSSDCLSGTSLRLT
jgi:hypothetical protein